jgi:hypothetical protein
VKTVLIFRGLARGRRDRLIESIRKLYDIHNAVRIDTPQPVTKLTKEQMRDLSALTFNQFKTEIAKNTELIIINNNNLKHHHYYGYMEYAQKNGYNVGVVLVPWNDLTDRELSIDSGGEISSEKFKSYRKAFEWGDFNSIKEYRQRQKLLADSHETNEQQ